jgi:hypothetical protein
VEIRGGSPTGTLLGTATVPATGAWQTYTDVTTTVSTSNGPLYFVARPPAGTTNGGGLLNVNWMDFIGQGAAGPAEPLSQNVHLFYYPWYGATNGAYRHWQQGGHTPPADIGANLYPKAGPYDSGDYNGVVDQHMRWTAQSGAGVLVYSWWGQGSYEDGLVPGVLAQASTRRRTTWSGRHQ